jgi:hypothetical protein
MPLPLRPPLVSALNERGVSLQIAPFTMADQHRFAQLSRDYNPVHIDDIAARRTMFGRTIVHGMHLILRALDVFAGQVDTPTFGKIVARFHRPVFLDEPLSLEMRSIPDGLEVSYVSDGAQLTTMTLTQPVSFSDEDWSPAQDTLPRTPRERSIEQMVGFEGVVPLPQSPADLRNVFPNASIGYGANRIANLLAVTQVIGMEVPGLHSMFATLSVELLQGLGTELRFQAKRVTPKLSHVQLQFESDALKGSAETFVRPRIAAVTLEACQQAVAAGEFSGRRALIIGGSRGLGLLTANLLAAGGADVVVTYRNGREEAESAVETLRAAGLTASAIHLDASSPGEAFDMLQRENRTVTDMFYFATPHIFVRKKKLFEDNLTSGFVKAYVSDFLAVLEETKKVSDGHLAVFYPSSDALNAPLKDLAEYYVGKMAGEAACEMLNLYDDAVTVTVERLPRLPTDQTATLMNVATADPVAVMLGICRRMAGPQTNTNQLRNG